MATTVDDNLVNCSAPSNRQNFGDITCGRFLYNIRGVFFFFLLRMYLRLRVTAAKNDVLAITDIVIVKWSDEKRAQFGLRMVKSL